MEGALKKMLQKRIYDLLSHKYGILLLIIGSFLLCISAFHFGEAWLEWSEDKYATVFHSYRDNIVGKSFRDSLSVPLPIDVVYTWVNGSDMAMIQQLELLRVAMEQKQNLSRTKDVDQREDKCTYTNCVPVGVLLAPSLRDGVTLDTLQTSDSWFVNVTSMEPIGQVAGHRANFTLLRVTSEAQMKQILHDLPHGWLYQGVNYTVKPAFFTSEANLPHGMLMPELVMMSGYPGTYTQADIQQAVIARLNTTDKNSVSVDIKEDKGLALLHLPHKAHYDSLSKDSNFTIQGKVIRLSPTRLVWDLRFDVGADVVRASRFADNEELRYSLRSVEKFAPWVHHIYIVTNGQIPYWLNLDNPRLTVITHDEIFQNQSHLPTFGSPAIEANIHRIPGLSDKFLYLNDDVMFGSPVWPEDFYTHTGGHKLYLTWPVPNCNEGCPSTWIKDGYCDKACNSSECEWDGGDCLAKDGQVQLGAGFHGDQVGALSDMTTYCATGCSNSWLADKYCDQACNSYECGFDAGDCGTQRFDQFTGIELLPSKTQYSLTPGEYLMYFNLTNILGETGKVTSAKVETNQALRTAAVANKFKVMTVLAYTEKNATTFTFHLEYQDEGTNDTKKLDFSLDVNTSVPRQETKGKPQVSEKDNLVEGVKQEDIDDATAFEGLHGQIREPVVPREQSMKTSPPLTLDVEADVLDVFSNIEMSPQLKMELGELNNASKNEELTLLGIRLHWQDILKRHGSELRRLKPQFDQQRLMKAQHNDNLGAQPQTGGQPEAQHSQGEGKDDQKSDLNGQSDGQHQAPQMRSVQDDKEQIQQHIDDLNSPQVLDTKHEYLQPKVQGLNLGMANNSKLTKQWKSFSKTQIESQRKKSLAGHGDGPSPQNQLGSNGANNLEANNMDSVAGIGLNPNIGHGAGPEIQVKTRKQRLSKDRVLGPGNFRFQPENHNIVQQPHKMNGGRQNVFVKEKKVGRQRVGGRREVGHEDDIDDGKDVAMVEEEDLMEDIQGHGRQGPGRRLLGALQWRSDGMDGDRQKDGKKEGVDTELSDGDFLQLVQVGSSDQAPGFHPWERKHSVWMNNVQKPAHNKSVESSIYQVERRSGRQLLDTFGDSLRHVNRIYNKAFGFAQRKVPAHMPHMIDKNVMAELQARFPEEWDATSSHRIRSSTDMQFAFAYFYYLMGVTEEVTVEQVFDEMDGDKSGILSDREIRTLAAKLYDLPLYLELLTGLEQRLMNCSLEEDPTLVQLSEEQRETYYDKDMPQVTRHLFTTCQAMIDLITEKIHPVPKYKTTLTDDSEIAFKMIHSNVSHVVGMLDDVRKKPRKFICLNDDIDHTREESKTVKALLQDFYESVLPLPSQFELPRDYRNRFLHMDELREWRAYRDRLRFWTHVALCLLVTLTIISFLGDKIDALKRKWLSRKGRRRRKTSSCSDSSSSGSIPHSPSPSSSSLWLDQETV